MELILINLQANAGKRKNQNQILTQIILFL